LAALLKRAEGKFNREDRRFVADLSGHHPYLAQAAAGVASAVGQGINTFIEAYAKQLAGG
jgi:hypothetical protein